jgi:hypothetical protein
LAGATFLVGQFQESRQFDALIPVVIGFVLCQARDSSLQGVACVIAKPGTAQVSAPDKLGAADGALAVT